MAGELEQLDRLVRDFNADAADRRAVAATVANAITVGEPLGDDLDAVLGHVADVLARRTTATAAVTAIEQLAGRPVFGAELKVRPGPPDVIPGPPAGAPGRPPEGAATG